jgi:hypothetical protein
MNRAEIPSDEELDHLYRKEVARALKTIADSILFKLDEENIGAGMPPRVGAAVALHALTLLGMDIAIQRGLKLEDIQSIIASCEQFITDPNGPVKVARRS